MELMIPTAAAAAAPERNHGGSDQKLGMKP
jgi:hypothetical protein